MATSKAAKSRRSDDDWESVRGRAWSRIVRATVERVLNRSEDLTPRMREPHFREHLVLSLKHLTGDGRDIEDSPGKVWAISGRQMDKLNEAQREQQGGTTGNAWTRWESGDYVPSESKISGAFGLFPGHVTMLGTDNDGKPMKAIDAGFAKLFWEVGPCRDDLASPLPLWSMMRGDTSVQSLWVPVLRYHDGSGLDGHAVADFLHGGVAFVRSQQPVPGAPSGTTRRSMFPKPGFTPAPGAAPSPYDGPSRSSNLLKGGRPLLNPDLPPSGQVTHLTANTTYQAQRLATLDADWFHRLIDAGTAAQDDDSAALGVGDVVVLTLATTFTAGDQGDLRHSLEDRVFTELRARHRRMVRWAQTFGIEGGVRRWLRSLHSDYLDRNGYGFLPVETPARPDDELVYDRDDPEAEYLAHQDNVPTVTVEPARPGRPTGDKRLSRLRKA